MCRVVFELASQLREVHTQVVGFVGVGRPPDLLSNSSRPTSLPRLRTSISRMPHSVGVRCTSAPVLATFFAARSTVNALVHRWLVDADNRGAAHRGTQPGQELVHAERFGDVIVRTGIERFHLIRRVGARRKHDHGRVHQPRSPASTSTPSISGSPRSRTTTSGGFSAAALSAPAPVEAVITSYPRTARLIRNARRICGSSSMTRMA